MPRQTDLHFTFALLSASDTKKPIFKVVEFRLEESLSSLFKLTVDLSSESPALDFGQLLDQPALLTIWHGEQAVRYVHGIISSVEQGATGFRRTRYRVVVEPQLARADLRSDWRIFQQQTVPQMLQTVLKRSGIADAEQHLANAHLPREYCVQPGETDLAFFARLSGEEGLYYAFGHSAQGHKLIQADVLYTHGVIPGGPVTYNPMPGGDQAVPCIQSLRYTENVRTARQTQADYTFKHPQYGQRHTSTGSNLSHQATDYERFDWPGRYKVDEAGKPFTQTRLLSLRRDAQIAEITGDDPRLQPGYAFDLEGHPRDEWNSGWRTVAMVHTGKQTTSQEEDSAEATVGTHYSYIAEIIPDRVEWKPPILPKPRIDGPQMAFVVGPQNEEIFCDEFGRVRVQFVWDRYGNRDEYSSCWIRVSQNWAGTAWGHMAIPRIGQEVIVSYIDGDPDQPLITGRTYPATNPPPYELPRYKTRMTIKSQTHKGEGYNELAFEDESGAEQIIVHAERDQNITVKNDETTQIGNDRKENVARDETIGIGRHRTESVGDNEQVTIGKDRRHQINQDAFLSIERNHTINIGKDKVESVGNHRKDQTTANHVSDVGGHVEQTVQGHDKLSAGQSIERQTQRYELQVGERAVYRGPGGSITLDDTGITIEGVRIHFKGHLEQDAAGGHAAIANRLALALAPYPPHEDCDLFVAAHAGMDLAVSTLGSGASTSASASGGDSGSAALAPQATGNTPSSTANPPPSGVGETARSAPAPVPCSLRLRGVPPRTETIPMEAGDYYQVDSNFQLTLIEGQPQFLRYSGNRKSFELRYDEAERVIVATLYLAVVPMEVRVRAGPDSPFEQGPNGRYATVPYYAQDYLARPARDGLPAYDGNRATHPTHPVCPRHPLAPQPNTAALSAEAERVLNTHGHQLIVDGCSQGDACGCRVSVRFAVKVVDPHDRHAPTAHATVNVYEQALRADSGNWGEVAVTMNRNDSPSAPAFIPNAIDHVVAHEAGHLFSWPDEYYADGGAIHRRFIQSQHVVPAEVETARGQPRWQGNSDDTLMGYGVYRQVSGMPPYYLERIADWFHSQNRKQWRVV